MSTLTAEELLAEVLSRNDRNQGLLTSSKLPFDEVHVLERLAESCQSVVAKMCKLDVEPESAQTGCATHRYELSGVINISGPLLVTVVINLSHEFALKATTCLTGTSVEHVDSDVIDVVGELANMIAGKAKESFANDEIALGLPTVITGKGHHICFRPEMNLTLITFRSPFGALQIEVGVAPRKASNFKK